MNNLDVDGCRKERDLLLYGFVFRYCNVTRASLLIHKLANSINREVVLGIA